jgi:hypothetical protein
VLVSWLSQSAFIHMNQQYHIARIPPTPSHR